MTWPAGLQNFWYEFRSEAQRLDNVTWPEGLESLTLGGFNRSLDNVTWPGALQSLTFGMNFD